MAPRVEERFLHIGEKTKLTAAGVGTVTYTSLDPSVATVDADGNVTAAGWGDCRIQVDISGGGNWLPYKGNVIVYVYQNDDNRGNDSSSDGSGNSTGTGSGSQSSSDNGDSEDSGKWDDDADEEEKNTQYTGLSAGSRFTASGVNYKVTAEGQVQYVKSIKSKKGSVRIPDTVYYRSNVYTVTSIAAKAFRKNTKITAVTIGKNITSIGKQAFYGCKKLKKITVLTTVLTEKNTGSAAFKGISKKASVRLPQKLTAKQKKNYRKWLKKQGFA